MQPTALPDGASLEYLKKRAKALLKAAQASEPWALDQIGPYFGRPASIGLQQAQLVIARSHGFTSWTALKRQIEEGVAPDPLDGLADRFLDLVCVSYSVVPDMGPARFRQAAALLDAHPELTAHSLALSVAAGDVAATERHLTKAPDDVHRPAGPFSWPPLMYAAYARHPGHSSFGCAHRVLEAGADATVHYFWGGECKFTALTGVLGHGEAGPTNQPEHPEMMAFAEALLRAGADPNDAQGCYNRCFTPGNDWLALLIRHGLDPEHRNDWLVEREGKLVPEGHRTMGHLMAFAAQNGDAERVRLLIDAGADVNSWESDHRPTAMPFVKLARLNGNEDIAALLEAAGASPTEMSDVERFRSACMAGDLETARALLANGASVDAEALFRLLHSAASQGRTGAVDTLLALGSPLQLPGREAPLHVAAYQGHLTVVQALLGAGADSTQRDPRFNGTPLDHAHFAGQSDIVRVLSAQPMDVFAAAAHGDVDRLRASVEADPGNLDRRFSSVRQSEQPSPDDWKTPLAAAIANGQSGAALWLIEAGADSTILDDNGRTLLRLAQDRGLSEVARRLG